MQQLQFVPPWLTSRHTHRHTAVTAFWPAYLNSSASWASKNFTILWKLGVTHDLGWWLVGKFMVDFLFVLTELFSLSITVPELWGEICTTRPFSQGSTSLHSNFILTGSSPINHSWYQKTRDTGLPDSEDHIPLHSLVLTQYRSVTDGRKDRRTERQICRSIYSTCKAGFAAHAVKSHANRTHVKIVTLRILKIMR